MAIGPLVSSGFMGWMLYDILHGSGMLGGAGGADKALNTGLMQMQPQMYGATQAADEMRGQRNFAENLSNMENLAKATHLPQKAFRRAMSDDLDSLLAGKANTLARAAIAPPTIQGMMASMSSQGAL
tara:strand:- start:8195 stop:8575 length:381 start_codon:yes stop_codon:yes gene_type:complete